MPEYPSPHPITVDARLASGALTVTAEERETTVVAVEPYDDSDASRQAADETQVEFHGDTLTIVAPDSRGFAIRWRSPKLRVTIKAPTGSEGRFKLAATDLTCRGEWRELYVGTATGNADIEQVTNGLTINTASGDLRVGHVGGQLTVHSASGDVSARTTGGPVEVKTASGDVYIETAESDVVVKSASGDTRVAAARQGTLRTTAVSGDVSIGVVSGTGVWLDLNSLSGNTRSDLRMNGEQGEPTGHELTIQARAVSGDIMVHRVTPAVP